MPGAIAIVWSLLSLFVAAVCTFSFMQPAWLLREGGSVQLGLHGYCVFDSRRNPPACGLYGGYFNLAHLPSNSWQAACVLYGGGCAFVCFGALLALLTLCMTHELDRRIAVFNGYIQTMGVVTMIAGLLIYPVGFHSRLVRHYCPNSAMYNIGSCRLGWAYMLGAAGTALAIFCPFLSQYTDFRFRPAKEVSRYDLDSLESKTALKEPSTTV